MLGAAGVGSDEGQVDVGLHQGRELAFGLLGSVTQTLHGHLVLAQVDAIGLLELADDVQHQSVVKVLAAEEGVSGCRFHLEDAILNLQDADVKCASSQVIHSNGAALFRGLQAVRQRGSSGLVNDTLDFQARDAAGVLGCLALAACVV